MIWKRNSKTIEDLEQKLNSSESKLSFLNSKFDADLIGDVFQNEGLSNENRKAFNDFLKQISSIKEDQVWDINSEIKILKQYIELYQSLKKEGLNVKVDFEISNSSLKLPCLILFPMVENAIKNGYNSMENYPLKIKLKTTEHILTFEVSNRVNHYLLNQASELGLNQFQSRLIKEFSGKYEFLVNSNSNLFKMTLLLKIQ